MKKNKQTTKFNIEYGIYIKPRDKISSEILAKLNEINQNYTLNKNFPKYEESIRQLFNLRPVQITNKSLLYLAGFIEGEGSMSAGVKKNQTSKFKLYIDPEFNITQHVHGISNLYLAMCSFKTGRIRYKSGSDATFVYTIDNRQNLKEKVLPFYEKYVYPFGSIVKIQRAKIFKELLNLFEQKAHLDLNRLMNEVLPLWDKMRCQVNQSNQSFQSLEEAWEYVQKASDHSLSPLSSFPHFVQSEGKSEDKK